MTEDLRRSVTAHHMIKNLAAFAGDLRYIRRIAVALLQVGLFEPIERGGGIAVPLDEGFVVIGGLRGGQAVDDVWACAIGVDCRHVVSVHTPMPVPEKVRAKLWDQKKASNSQTRKGN